MIVKKKFEVPDMNLEALRDDIIFNLHEYLEASVVMLEQIPKKPSYPFIAYKFIVPYNISGQRGILATNLVDGLGDRFEKDYEETIHFQPQITLSITAYSLDELESSELAQKAHDYFKHAGYYDLQRMNTVVVSTAAFGNRNTLIVDDYERRTGFDVILRTTDKITRRLETIEEYNIEEIE